MKKILGGVFSVFAFAVALPALVGLQGNVAYTQPQEDHFKTYRTSPEAPLELPTVSLKDQFGTVEGTVTDLYMFSPPVCKDEPYPDCLLYPQNHLAWYRFEGTGPQRNLLVTNQFGPDQSWTVGNPVFLVLPAEKRMVDFVPLDPPPLVELDHYLCYDVLEGPSVDLVVDLQDQFQEQLQATVGTAEFFCNPVEKTVLGGGSPSPIYNPDNHLACYDIDPKVLPPIDSAAIYDQFVADFFHTGELLFDVYAPMHLCVPSQKCIVVDKDEDGHTDINCGGDDCNDGNANIFPGNTNNNCDCVDPTPQGTPENQTAGNCTDGEDNDCDGIIDTDPECTGGSCTGTAAASTLEGSQDQGPSGLSKHLAYFLVSVGALIGLIIWRRKR